MTNTNLIPVLQTGNSGVLWKQQSGDAPAVQPAVRLGSPAQPGTELLLSRPLAERLCSFPY